MTKKYEPSRDFASNAHIDSESYKKMYDDSLNDPENFWLKQADEYLTWHHFPSQTVSGDFAKGESQWFADGELNVCYNCIDRHLPEHADKTAIVFEGDDPNTQSKLTYSELHEQVCLLANVIKSYGISKGDRVCIYMPMISEAAIAMLACARIGVVHSVVFGGFSAQALRDRINDSDCCLVITADQAIRGNKIVELKKNVDEAITKCPSVRHVLVVKHTNANVNWNETIDTDYETEIKSVSSDCKAEAMQAEDPLFILYTSGSTGKPKGIVHTSGGYLLNAAMTFNTVFDYHDNDVFWCTADVGWITGHTYSVYGPLANGATTLIFAGVPNYPDASRFWQVVDKHKVSIFYTAPTAIRALMREGDEFVTKTNRKSLRVLGTVGEPINPEAWRWYYDVVGEARCPIVDTWWQTETGAHMLTPLPGATTLKPGSATRPFFGVEPALVDDNGNELEGEATGKLVIKRSWPGQLRGIYGDKKRFLETYFKVFPGYYFTGDNAHRDGEGDYWITGRVDDVLNVSGHRLGTAEVESALVEHPQIAEAAVVGFPHEVKGQGIYAFVTLMEGVEASDELKQQALDAVKQSIGSIAKPEYIQWTSSLPKTRSGKIMRRILRKIVEKDIDNIGDTSTLADPTVVETLISNCQL